MTVAWGLLSTARINDLVLAGARGSERARFVAVASRDTKRALAYADTHQLERAHGSYEALLADPDVEAVYISLPNAFHVDWSIRALETGKHVLCEKPLTRSSVEAERAFRAAEQAGRLLTEGFMFRHHAQTQRLQQLVAEGAIGELRLIRSAFRFVADDPADTRLFSDYDGGSLMDVGCYCVSASRLLAGEPLRVYAEHERNEHGVDTALAATMLHPQGIVSQFDSALTLPERMELELVGTRGSIRVADPWHCIEPELEVTRDGSVVEREHFSHADCYRLELDDLSAAIRGEGTPLLGRDDAVAQARTIEALLESAATGAPITLET